jgi:DNA-directed RNA polymerase delta subunit
MLDVATRFIGLEAENKQLRSHYELDHSRANVMADKLKAAEKALEEAKASLAATEQHLEDEKSSREVHDEDIRKRLEALNASLLSMYLPFFL